MFRKWILIALLLPAFSAKSQSYDTAQVSIRYTFNYKMDTTNLEEVTTENMMLLIGKQSSVYKNHDNFLRDSVMRIQFQKEVLTPGGTNTVVSPRGMRSGSPTAFYKFPAANKLSQLEILMGYYLIDETIPGIDWVMSQDTKTIKGLSCQKATATFRGRNYTAWFCSQLPYNNGPWKLGGLPGLILEAEDDQKEVVFTFESFEDVSARNMLIVTPPNAIPTNMKDFRKLREAVQKDPKSMLGGNNTAGAVSLSVTRVVAGAPLATPVKKKVNNNPIERMPN